MEPINRSMTTTTSLRTLTPAEQVFVKAALTLNKQGEGEETAIILDPVTTTLKGVGKVEPMAKSIQAIKDLPTHYAPGAGAPE